MAVIMSMCMQDPSFASPFLAWPNEIELEEVDTEMDESEADHEEPDFAASAA